MGRRKVDATEKLDPQDYLAPVWRFKWIILAIALAVAAATYAYYQGKPKVYESSTQIYLGQSGVQQQITGTQQESTERDLANQAELVRSPPVAARVAKKPGIEGNPDALLNSLQVVTDQNADVLTLVASWPNPEGAARVANAFAQAFLDQRIQASRADIDTALRAAQRAMTDLQHSRRTSGAERIELASRISELQTLRSLPPGHAVQLDQARPPASASEPRPTRNAIFAFVLALAFGILAAYAVNRIDRRIRQVDEVSQIYDVPLLGTIPRAAESLSPGPPAIPISLLESFRALRTSLEVAGAAQGTLLITSGTQGEGKSTIVRNLGIAYREAGKQTVIVEADLRQPTGAGWLSTPEGPGLTDLLSGTATLDDALHQVPLDAVASLRPPVTAARHNGASANGGSEWADFGAMPSTASGDLWLLPGGSSASDPATLLGSLKWLLIELSERFDLVLIDTPALLPVSDAMPLVAAVDGTLLVSRVGTTTGESAEDVVKLVGGVPGARVLGVVANDVPLASLRARYGYRQYAPTG
jgi:Mrp family chromosome partitioning ATPase